VYVEGLTEHLVSSKEQFIRLLAIGSNN